MEGLKRDIANIDAWIVQWHEFAGREDDAAMTFPGSAEFTAPRASRTTGNPPKEEVAAKAIELILAKGAPMSRNALFADLEANGVIIRGADPKMVLSTMLWRSGDIVRLPGLGYWLKKEPYEPAGYTPDNAFADNTSGGGDREKSEEYSEPQYLIPPMKPKVTIAPGAVRRFR
jgi:hypothetical protein